MTPQFTGWRTSTRSTATQTCVEVGSVPGLTGIRDTKDRTGGTLAVPIAQWSAFVSAIKTDRFGRYGATS